MGYMNGYFPQYQMPGGMYQGRDQMLKGRPVSSIDEVRAAQIDFDGSIYFFPDLANRKIYTKQITIDGTASINVYSIDESSVPQSEPYVSRQEFEELKTYVIAALGGINEPAAHPADVQLPSF